MVKENKLPVVLETLSGTRIVHVVGRERVFDSRKGPWFLLLSFICFVASGLMFGTILINEVVDTPGVIVLSIIAFVMLVFGLLLITWTFEDRGVVKHDYAC